MDDIPNRLGLILRRRRLAEGWTQSTVADRIGVSISAYSRMELGDGGPVALDRWIVAAAALGMRLAFEAAPLPPPELDGRLWRLVRDLAERGGWSTHAVGPPTSPGGIVITRPARRESAAVAIWDLVGNVEAAIGDLRRSMDREAARRPEGWRVGGLVVVLATGPNRRRISEERGLVDDTFPDSGSRWIGALGNSKSRMPEVPAFVWASGGATRLTPARLPLIRPRRAMRD